MKNDGEVVAELERASEGLLFMSEADYPFETVYWKELPEMNPKFLLSAAGLSDDVPVETVSVDHFFRIATSEESWRSENERREAKKYQNLVRILKDNLDELKVYRLGSINIPVYIVGRNKTGSWLGISTRVVET